MSNIGEKIKNIRLELQKTQQEFADELGLSRSGITQMESGKTNPSFEIIYKIVSMYGINPEHLFSDTESIRKESVDSEIRGLSKNDINVLKKMGHVYYFDEIIPYIHNSEARNKAILKELKKELSEKIDSFNKLMRTAELLQIVVYHPSAKDYELINEKEYINSLLLESDPSEFEDGIAFDSKNTELMLKNAIMKENISHVSYLIDKRIATLNGDISFMVKNKFITFLKFDNKK